ncbi:MAG: hypothetical protein WCK49_05345 [Myxococcaceae bacterium]
MQTDGNFLIYSNIHKRALWSSRTHGHPGAVLNLQDKRIEAFFLKLIGFSIMPIENIPPLDFSRLRIEILGSIDGKSSEVLDAFESRNPLRLQKAPQFPEVQISFDPSKISDICDDEDGIQIMTEVAEQNSSSQNRYYSFSRGDMELSLEQALHALTLHGVIDVKSLDSLESLGSLLDLKFWWDRNKARHP